MANTYDTNVKLQAIATAIANSGTSDPNLLAKLQAIADAITGGSNTDYDNLTNKPQINGVTLSGNKVSLDLGLISSSSIGVASGVAELDNTGHVPSSQLPSYVDDVVEGYYDEVTNKFYSDNAYTTEIPGETGKIYITLDTNLSYRYTGSGFVVVSPSLALGETSSTAYRGDRGKIAYDTSQSNSTAIGNINTALGNTSISGIGDGTVTGAISDLNSTYINGLKWKTFGYTYYGATVADSLYVVSNAREDIFDLTASNTILGVVLKSEGGNSNFIFTTPSYVSASDEFIFKPDANNSLRTRFDGFVFYI